MSVLDATVVKPLESDVSIGTLELRSENHDLNTQIGGQIIEGKLEETMAGASELTLELIDREYNALQSGIFGTRVTALVDGAEYSLTEVNIVDDWRLELKFEHALIAEMRRFDAPLKVQRGTLTRAEFIKSMLSELRRTYLLVCPELEKAQPIEAAKEAASAEAKGETPQRWAEELLKLLGAPESTQNIRAIVGWETAEGGNWHNSAKFNPLNTTQIPSSGPSSTFQSVGVGAAAIRIYTSWQQGLAATVATLQNGKYKGILAALAAGTSSEAVAQAIGASPWGTSAAGVQQAITGTPITSFSGKGATRSRKEVIKTAQYEFSRGKAGQREDTYTCALRLASEVNWHFFIVGVNTIYFVDDDDLKLAKPTYRVKPTSEGLVKLTSNCDVSGVLNSEGKREGGRTVILHGKRQPKPSEAELIARIERWGAPPGCVIEVDGYGPLDGSWLVEAVERSLFTAEARIHLRAPQAALAEAASTIKATPGVSEGTGSGLPGVVEAAKRAMEQRGRYSYAEVRPIPPSLFPPPGTYPVVTDCSGFITLCFKAAGLPDPNGNGYNGEGYTGTLIAHATKIGNPEPGCLLFFGSSPAATVHVVLYIGNGRGIGMEDPELALQEGDAIGLGAGAGSFLGYYRAGS